MQTATQEPIQWRQPDIGTGTMVLWHSNPFNPDQGQASMGWVCQTPGYATINCLVWTPASGFVEKASVRHKDDPFWKESETAAAWQKWGCYEVHPDAIATKELRAIITKLKLEAAAKADKAK